MTIDEFNVFRFGGKMKAKYDNEIYAIISVNFTEALIGLISECEDPDDVECWKWCRCENVELITE